jgi:hypothetical protein
MPSRTDKLLEQMKNSKSNWKRNDLDRLYEGFGFIIKHGGNHDIVKHPKYPQLRATLPRHREIAKVYVECAVKLIDTLLELEKEKEGQNEQ